MTTISYPVAGTDYRYWVFETDSKGYEIPELQTGERKFVSPTLVSLVSDTKNPVTDVIIAIHGWNTTQQGNEEISFYDVFFDALMKDYVNFPPQSGRLNPLLIGVHWPSAPGSGRANERIDDESTFDDNVARIEKLAKGLQKTDPPAAERIEKILHQITAAAVEGATGLSEPALQANVSKVENLLENPADNVVDNDPGISDITAASAEKVDGQVISTSSEGGTLGFARKILTSVFRPLEDKIFGQFVRRSDAVGENGVHNLLALLQEYAPSTTRFHLICHSLGASALCRALVGGENSAHLLRKKVHSATFLQGALGSHCFAKGQTFERMTRDLLPVAGPMVVTTSQSDRALLSYQWFHDEPLGLNGAVDVDPMPLSAKPLGDVSVDYAFQSGQLFNIIADKYVDEGDLVSGSHNDVFGPEMMRMLRQAIDCRVEHDEYMLPTTLSREYFSERVKGKVDTDVAQTDKNTQAAQPSSAGQRSPTEQTSPAEQSSPTEQTSPAEQSSPTEQTSPAEQPSPTEQPSPAEKTSWSCTLS